MKAIRNLAASGFMFSVLANAAPAYNGSVKGAIDGKAIDVKAVCERMEMGSMKRLTVRTDPGMSIDAKDRDGDGIVVSASGDLVQPLFAFTVLAGDRVYKFGGRREVKPTPTGLEVKGQFKASPKTPELKPYDVDLTIDCP
jgi:hypothetical protein